MYVPAFGSFACRAVVIVAASFCTAAWGDPYSQTVLHAFSGQDGTFPNATLVQDTDGSFYGTTEHGGANGDYGTVFRIAQDGVLSTLHSFGNPDGAVPFSLRQGGDGDFYGTTVYGGSGNNDYGTVFKITRAGALTTLHDFANQDGKYPYGRLIQGSDGSFYGTTYAGGANGMGTIYRITAAGVFASLYSFSGPEGAFPEAGLVQGNDGNFYGTTAVGGDNSDGTLFRINAAGVLTVLHSFGGSDGSLPISGLILGSDGNLYGTTSQGGASGDYGTIFKITPAGDFTTLYSFSSQDGASPLFGSLVQDSSGNFYGVTAGGGTGNVGTAFRIAPDGTLATLFSFSGQNGSYPYAGLFQDSSGNLFGTTSAGGSSNDGVIFELQTAAAPPTLALYAHPSQVGIGNSAVLDWQASGASSCTASGTWSGGEPTSGSQSVTVTQLGANNYSLTCSGQSGTVTKTVSITGLPPPTLGLTAEPTSQVIECTATLTWTTANVTNCGAYGAWSGGQPISGSASVSSQTAGTRQYTLNCDGPGGSVSKTVSIAWKLPTVSFATAAEQTPKGNLAGQSTTTLRVNLSDPISYDVTVPFSVGGTDPAGRYSISPSGSIHIPALNTAATITVKVKYPAWLQCDRTIRFTLGAPQNATLGAVTSNTLTVHNYSPIVACVIVGK